MPETRSQITLCRRTRKPPGRENAFQVVLSISRNEEDRASLKGILDSGWTVLAKSTVGSALSLLRETPIPIVIYDCEIPSGAWGEMLDQISLLSDPPLFILASRLADERVWAEALNLGAWDVLAKPFVADEVTRIVDIARQHWQDRHGLHITRTRQRMAANGSGRLPATGT